MLNLADGRNFGYMWETGRQLACPNTPDGATAFFMLPGRSEPIPMDVHNNLVDVPDEAWQQAEAFTVYLYTLDAAGRYTRFSRTITVRWSPRPDNYAYTPTELRDWHELAERIAALEGEGIEKTVAETVAAAVEGIADKVIRSEAVQQLADTAGEALERAESAEHLAAGMNTAKGFASYAAMIDELNQTPADQYRVGQSFLIVTLDVPDVWVSEIEDTSVPYTYVDDTTITAMLQSYGYFQVGYYKLSPLETLKQDLSNYVKKLDYGTKNSPGVVQIGDGINIDENGVASVPPPTDEQIFANTKKGMTENTLPLTAEEQAAAQRWMGVTGITKLYPNEGETFVEIALANLNNGMYVSDYPIKLGYVQKDNNPNSDISKYDTINSGVVFNIIRSFNDGTASGYALCVYSLYAASNNVLYTYHVNQRTDLRTSGGIISYRPSFIMETVSDQIIKGVKTFSAQPKMTAELAAYDNSTNIPNTAWVNAAIEAKLAGRGL